MHAPSSKPPDFRARTASRPIPLRPPGPRDVFWGEIAPAEHVLQIYENDSVYEDALEGWVAGGLHGGEGVVVIATPAHRTALGQRLARRGLDVDVLAREDRFIALDADETLARFMRDRAGLGGWPDDELFHSLVLDLLERAGAGGRRVRAFGEMVAILWARGQTGATVRLEHLWHRLCEARAFSLFCAYPKAGFTQDAAASIRDLCAAHSSRLPG